MEIVDVFLAIWDFDHGLAVVFVLAAIGFVSTTILIVTKTVGGVIAGSRQVHGWLRESGRLTKPDAPTPDLGAEPPALVNLLVNHGKLDRDAVRATVLDLAARGAVTLYQPDHDPAGTVVMGVRERVEGATPYEERALDELRRGGPRVRLSSLPFLQERGLRRWHRQFRREVVKDARDRKLTYVDTSILNATVAGTFVPCSVIGFFGGVGPIVVIVYIVLTIVVGSRTRVWLGPTGREALARWLGVRGWLEAHEVFADLPPAAVTVWGRYLAYGAALRVVRPAPP